MRLSTLTNAGLVNVARHEALHAFWSKFVKNNPKAVKVLSSLTDDPRVLRRLQALLKNEPAALEQLADGEERLAALTLPASTILASSRSKTANQIGKLLFTNPGDEADGGGEQGYLNARNMMMRRYDNAFRSIIDDLDARQMTELVEAMQQETVTADLKDSR